MTKKTPMMLLIEEKTGKDIREYLISLYIEKDMTITEIIAMFNKELDISISTAGLWKWLVKLDIPRRHWSLIGNK